LGIRVLDFEMKLAIWEFVVAVGLVGWFGGGRENGERWEREREERVFVWSGKRLSREREREMQRKLWIGLQCTDQNNLPYIIKVTNMFF
jgi:hypothetical protein